MDDPTTIKYLINWWIAYNNLTQAELARQLNMTRQNLAKKINAKYIDEQFLKNIAKITNTEFHCSFAIKTEDIQERITLIRQLNAADYQLVKQLINRLLNKDN